MKTLGVAIGLVAAVFFVLALLFLKDAAKDAVIVVSAMLAFLGLFVYFSEEILE